MGVTHHCECTLADFWEVLCRADDLNLQMVFPSFNARSLRSGGSHSAMRAANKSRNAACILFPFFPGGGVRVRVFFWVSGFRV